MKLVLDKKEPVADGVVLLTLRDPDDSPLPAWTPGAHVDLVLGDGLVRQYSLCGDPADTSAYQVAVLRAPEGRGGSRHLHDVLAEGQLVEVGDPRNHFELVEARRYLFVAGGIGITPILPMVAWAEAAGRDWRLVYGGRTRSSMAFRTTLEQRANVEIRPQDEYGQLDLEASLGDPAPGTAVYCCGPESLLLAVEQQCAAWPRGALHVERFSPRTVAPPNSAEFEVELARTGAVLRVPSGKSVLDVLEEQRVSVLWSCREGTCGTCETTVLNGTPDHRDSVLTDEEQECGDVMMVCVSRSRSTRLVLDL
ncbi:PDR/VanB family oxidoreductase [Lentzea cavernae]|uniref:Ferredoxin n=1 Tax=Lentzea cavernae TaxID=2020703 RepID=A0ABQ3MQ97_9PSEU|nr:PDR/VanB family oxidoreductase [Lentzea cavernae]GHH43144.1 ferredoxin [Lentzea cavernae]